MFNVLSSTLVIAGACILISALILVRRLIAQLPAVLVRRRWYVLSVLIGFFVLGYISYTAAF